MSVLGLLALIAGVGGIAALMWQNEGTAVQIQAANQTWSGDVMWLIFAAACLGALALLGLSMLAAGAARTARARRERRALDRERRDLQAENERLEKVARTNRDRTNRDRDRDGVDDVNTTTPVTHHQPMEQAPAQHWPAQGGPVTYPPRQEQQPVGYGQQAGSDDDREHEHTGRRGWFTRRGHTV